MYYAKQNGKDNNGPYRPDTIDESLERRPEIFVKVRSTRPPRPAWLRFGAHGAVEVELIAGEDGVSPGQACVFYESAAPDARVLGGGSIRATESAWTPSLAAQPLRAALAGR